MTESLDDVNWLIVNSGLIFFKGMGAFTKPNVTV